MASGEFSLTRTGGSTYMSYRCVWISASDTANNYSDLTIYVYTAKSAVSTAATYGTVNTAAAVGGDTKYVNGLSLYVSPGAEQLIFAKDGYRVYHDTDGSKTVNISVSVGGDIVSASGSTNAELDHIPRASTLDSWVCSTEYLDGTFTYKTTPKTGDYYNRLRVSIPNVVALEHVPLGKQSAEQHTGNYTLSSALLESIYNRYPNAASCSIGGVIESYSNSDYTGKIGESSEISIFLKFPESVKPSCDFTIADTTGYYASFGAYVQQNSALLITTSAVTAYGSSIKSYTVTFEGKAYNAQAATTDAISGSGTIPVKVKVTDSRGRTSAEITKNITVLAYEAPKITLEAYRCTLAGTRSDDGAYIKIITSADIASLGGQNSAEYIIKYKTSDAQEWTEITGSGTEYTSAALPFDVSHPGEVMVWFVDRITTTATPQSAAIPIAFTLWEAYHTGRGISFGETATEDGFNCALDAKFKGAFSVTAMPDYITEEGTTEDGWYYEKRASGSVKMYKSLNYSAELTGATNVNVSFTDELVFPFAVSSLINCQVTSTTQVNWNHVIGDVVIQDQNGELTGPPYKIGRITIHPIPVGASTCGGKLFVEVIGIIQEEENDE